MYLPKKISYLLTTEMISHNIISMDDFDAFSYTYEFLFEQIMYLVFMFFISLLFHRVTIFFIFLTTFIPIRIFGGGAHASNEKICICLSFSIFLLALFIPTLIISVDNRLCSSLLVSVILIDVLIAPVDVKNKRLSILHKKALKKKFIISCTWIFIEYIIFYILSLRICYISLSLCVILASVSLFIGALNNVTKIKER